MKKEYLIYKLSEDLKEATRIENELFRVLLQHIEEILGNGKVFLRMADMQ